MNGPSVPGGCASTAERLPELALGILGGSERADVLAHLDRCPSCRAESEAWASTADVLPTLLGEAEPPAGFEARTLERLHEEQALVPRWSWWRRAMQVAAIILGAVIVTLGTVRILDARSSGSSKVAETQMASVPMIGRSGHHAGNAFMTGGEDRYVFLDVDYGAGSGRYEIEAVDDANQSTRIGAVDVESGHGVWAGELPKGATGLQTVRMIGADGKVFCWAKFGPVAT